MVDTTLAPPVQIKPPFREPPLDKTGQAFSDPWVAWFTNISDRIAFLTPPGGPQPPITPITTHTGTSTTDGSGVFTATWPAFSSVFMGLSIAPSDPIYPGATFSSVTSITLSSYSATLVTTDNLYPTPTTSVLASTTFNWVVQGY